MELQQPERMVISSNPNKLFVQGFLYVLQETWSQDFAMVEEETHDGGQRCNPRCIGTHAAGNCSSGSPTSLAFNPIHGVIQPSKSNQNMFWKIPRSWRRDLAQGKLKSKPESSPEFSVSRRTESCRQLPPDNVHHYLQQNSKDEIWFSR